MDEQIILFSLLQVYRSNIQILHWKTIGDEFDAIHVGVTNDYYNKMAVDVDAVAETLVRQGYNPPNYFNVVKALKGEEYHFKIVKDDQDYDKKEIISTLQGMFSDICSQIIKVLETDEMREMKNVGIKSYYESLYNEYDKEMRFFNTRRMPI